MDDVTKILNSMRELAKHLPQEEKRLPQWSKGARGAPAAVMRSALFGMVGRGKRRMFDKKLVAAWRGDQIIYSGWQLDQADLDCWLQILHLAKGSPLDEDIYFTGRQFLKAINRDPTGNAHKWLRASLGRLQFSAVHISLASGADYQGPLVYDFDRDETTTHYVVQLNVKIAQLFDDAFVKINHEKRKMLRADLSRWLQGYIQSHQATPKNPHQIRLTRLQELCGSSTKSRLRRFKQQVNEALIEIVDLKILVSFEFKSRGTVVEWIRTEQKSTPVE